MHHFSGAVKCYFALFLFGALSYIIPFFKAFCKRIHIRIMLFNVIRMLLTFKSSFLIMGA